MAPTNHTGEPGAAVGPRQTEPARRHAHWRTAITHVELNRILIRGYPVDEMMGRLSFGEAVYLLLVGELPSPAIGKLMEALLVSSLDHSVTPPSTLAARCVATTGAPLRASVAAGILAFGRYHGGDIESCMRCLETGVAMVHDGLTYADAAERLVADYKARHEPVPGFGHRIHSHDPRAARLFQMALELELDGDHTQMARATERALNRERHENPIPINVDGAIAAVCSDMGLDASVGNALFIISRVPGLIAHAHEEQERERRMRQIDASGVTYDGPSERRLPESRRER